MVIEASPSLRRIPLLMDAEYHKTITDQAYRSEADRLKMLSEGYLFPTVEYSMDALYRYVKETRLSVPYQERELDNVIKSNLHDGYCVFLTVDRFFYPSGREAGRTSLIHPVFIIGYDDKLQCYRTIEDCILPGTMAYYDLPYSAVRQSCEQSKAEGRDIKISLCKPMRGDLTVDPAIARTKAIAMLLQLLEDTSVFYNAQYDLHVHRGIAGLERYRDEFIHLFANLKDDSIYKLFTLRFQQVHRRNQQLIAFLHESGYLNKQDSVKLIPLYKSLESSWDLYKKRSYYHLASAERKEKDSQALSQRLYDIIALERLTARAFMKALHR